MVKKSDTQKSAVQVTSLRIPRDVYDQARAMANLEDMSFNELVVDLLEQMVKRQQRLITELQRLRSSAITKKGVK